MTTQSRGIRTRSGIQSRVLRVICDTFRETGAPVSVKTIRALGGADFVGGGRTPDARVSQALTHLKKRGLIESPLFGYYMPGDSAFKIERKRALSHALEEREVLKAICRDLIL